MKSLLLIYAALVCSASAQYVTVSGSHVQNANGTPVTGTIHFQPVSTAGTPIGYRLVNNGQVTLQEVSTPITAGVFSMKIVDTTQTQPQNVCYRVWVTDNKGTATLGSPTGGNSSGYNCLQVAPTWCAGTVCNFDQFPPNYAPIGLIVNPWLQSISIRHQFVGAGTYSYVHSLKTLTPLQTCFVNSGSSTYSTAPTDANTVAVTVNGPADITCAFGATPVAVFQPSASFTLNAASMMIFQSSSGIFPVTFTGVGGYAKAIAAAVSGLPNGMTASFSPSGVQPSIGQPAVNSSLTLTASSTVTLGTNTFTASGADGAATQTLNVPLTVLAGPVQQWFLNEQSGSSFTESSGHANTLTGANITFTNVTGISYKVPTFNGTTSYMDTANATNTNFTGSTAFTVSAWVTFADNSTNSTIISTLDSANNFKGWEFSRQSDGSLAVFLVNSYSSNAIEKHFNSLTFTAGQAYHVALTYDGSRSAAGLNLYINGTLWSTSTAVYDSLTATMANTIKPRIGGRPGSSPDAHGSITDLRIFTRALPLSDVANLYLLGAQ